MTLESEPSRSRVEAYASRLADSLPRRYGFILLAVGTLLVVDQAVLQPRLERLSVYAPQINVSGRQRMLSQKLTKAALAMMATDGATSRRQELQDTLTLWRTSHYGLLDGSPDLGLPRTNSIEIRQAFADLEPHFIAMGQAAEALIAGDASATQVDVMLEHEAQFLPTMDRIVGLYELEARSHAKLLRFLGLIASSSVIALMIALGHLVLRPAIQTIRGQIETLEDRVEERTTELTRLNVTLRREVQVREQAEERTRELAGQLAHTSRVMSMGQLATGLAHEVNQPLAAIANYSDFCKELLKKEPVDQEKLKQTVGWIRRSTDRAGDIVRGMRNFLQPGLTPVSEVDVKVLVEEVVALCRPELVQNDVELEVVLDSAATISVSPTQIQQVLVNLIQNAVQAMQHCDRDKRRLSIRATHQPDYLLLEVIDSGTGFGDLDPESIFEPFYTTKDSGLGMGLAIARTIVEEHAGRLWAENRPVGAAVCFTLPLNREEHDGQFASDSHCVCR